MAKASASIELPVSAEEVWRLIGGFGGLADWLPFMAKCELSDGGRVRTLTSATGQIIVERLAAFDEKGRSYSYTFEEGAPPPFPVTGYLSTLSVRPADSGKGCRVDWSAEFTPDEGREAEASPPIQALFEGGLKILAQRY